MSDTTPGPTATPEGTRSPWHISRIPGHLGRARTSTVVMSVLFVAIFALYLYVKPDTPATATSVTDTQVPVTTTAPARTTAAPTTTPEPTQEQPTTTEAPTSTGAPTDTTTSESPTGSTVPTTTPSLPTPTVSSPTG
jgi:hypothetical protein